MPQLPFAQVPVTVGHVDPDATHVAATQHPPPLHVSASQQGPPAAPHAAQVPPPPPPPAPPLQTLPVEHVRPAQHACPAPPQASQTPEPALQAAPVSHELPAQHIIPGAPHLPVPPLLLLLAPPLLPPLDPLLASPPELLLLAPLLLLAVPLLLPAPSVEASPELPPVVEPPQAPPTLASAAPRTQANSQRIEVFMAKLPQGRNRSSGGATGSHFPPISAGVARSAGLNQPEHGGTMEPPREAIPVVPPSRSPMLPTSRRALLSLVAVTTAFLAGIAFDAVEHREARAQSLTTSTIYVPEGGLVFRATDGTPLARLSRDPHGATFELYDDHLAAKPDPHASELRGNPYIVDEQASVDAARTR